MNKEETIQKLIKLGINPEKAKVLDLHEADLQGTNLQGADLWGANLRYANLQHANLQGAKLQGADLRWAKLQGASLQHADLQDANLDFSVFPLWCGGTKFKADDRLVQQVLAHLCSLDVSDEMRLELDKITDCAKKSHRWNDCNK